MLQTGLSVIDVYKSFGATRALNGVSLEVRQGEIVAVLGPSGSGKSTLLSLIAGLETPDTGDILWNGVSLLGLPPNRRGFGLMFQDYALFPHMNVYENIAFGLRMEKLSMPEIRRRVEEMLRLVGLSGFEHRDVNTLSGGEQQRVAMARSLAPRPRLLMLDEPLGALDRTLRERLLDDLRHILRGMRQTALYVTHDQEEAFTLADRVILMNAGKVEQSGSPQEIYLHPSSPFVARFLGLDNLVRGQAVKVDGRTVVETPLGQIPVQGNLRGEVWVLLRPDSATLDGDGPFTIQGKVVEVAFRGSTCRVRVDANGVPLTFEFLAQVPIPAEGQPIRLSFDPRKEIRVYPA